MKKFNVLISRIICLGLFFITISLVSAHAEKGTRELNGVTMHYDTDAKEVRIETSRDYSGSVEDTLQDLLHFRVIELANHPYMFVNLKVTNTEIIGRNQLKFDTEKSFHAEYGFLPDKLTFNGVVYEIKDNTMLITSDEQRAIISPACVGCFEIAPTSCFVPNSGPGAHANRDPKRVIFNLVIKGRGFTEIPIACFVHVKNLL